MKKKFGPSKFIYLKNDPKYSVGPLASSLQTFETSLMMIALRRWTNSVVCIANAIEIILNQEFSNQFEKDKFQKQINEYCQKYKISNELKQAAHDTRVRRNHYIHQAIIPSDNFDAAKIYLLKALSFYKICLEYSHGLNLYEYFIDYRNFNDKVATNLKIAKDLAKNKAFNQENFNANMEVLVKTIANATKNLIPDEYSENMLFIFEDDKGGNFFYEMRRDWENRLKEKCQGDVIGPYDDPDYEINCPANCSDGALYLEIHNDEMKTKVFRFAKCFCCGLELVTEQLIKIYVRKALGEEKIKKLIKEYGL